MSERPHYSRLDEDIIWNRVVAAADGQYRHLKVIGRIPSLQIPLPAKRRIDVRFLDPLFARLPDNYRALKKSAGPYYYAYGDIPSYDISIRKMDVPPKRWYKESPHWESALSYVYDTYETKFKHETRVVGTEELFESINGQTSPGVPLVCVGFKTKQAVLSSHYGCLYLNSVSRTPPVWRVVDKHEWYHQDDLRNNKVRTFIIPPLKLLLDQKRYFLSQNNAMKNFHWSAYGFNPYSGGTHRLADRLMVNNVFIMYDVRGWDRLLNILTDVYEMRNSFHRDSDLDMALHIAKDTCESILLLADGTLVFKNTGNNSGSGCTTPDNILAHTFILAYTLLTLYDGDEMRVRGVVAALFGDDDVLSLPDDGIDFKELEETFRKCFLDFGLELDPFVVSRKLSDMEFLGFTFTLHKGTWLPKFKIDKIVASFCYEYEKNTKVDAQLSKAYSLLVMAYPTQTSEYFKMREIYEKYLYYLRDSEDPVVKSYVQGGTPTEYDIMNFYTGREVSVVSKLFKEEGLEQICLNDGYEQSTTWRESARHDGEPWRSNPAGEGLVHCSC